jgi:hypothetical protein
MPKVANRRRHAKSASATPTAIPQGTSTVTITELATAIVSRVGTIWTADTIADIAAKRGGVRFTFVGNSEWRHQAQGLASNLRPLRV